MVLSHMGLANEWVKEQVKKKNRWGLTHLIHKMVNSIMKIQVAQFQTHTSLDVSITLHKKLYLITKVEPLLSDL